MWSKCYLVDCKACKPSYLKQCATFQCLELKRRLSIINIILKRHQQLVSIICLDISSWNFVVASKPGILISQTTLLIILLKKSGLRTSKIAIAFKFCELFVSLFLFSDTFRWSSFLLQSRQHRVYFNIPI